MGESYFYFYARTNYKLENYTTLRENLMQSPRTHRLPRLSSEMMCFSLLLEGCCHLKESFRLFYYVTVLLEGLISDKLKHIALVGPAQSSFHLLCYYLMSPQNFPSFCAVPVLV